MYLKRLEIQGFKSFAGKNSFEFGPGITAVVGPNGSGKSNLADALRWVLGEQNPRVLRSRKAEEIVFAGGRRRPPAGLAEASIVLDNADGWLPVAFDEVMVTRRLHRSGESEYLINRARVRLRDLLDLLSRGRVGQNSYAIMGQGLVDQVLNLHPEERRSLIEEAADVRRHRLKIQDAVERLSATRDNLDRVDLLVGEIAPRLEQLRAQAQRAGEHAGLATALAEALKQLFATQWQARNAALAEARDAYADRMRSLLAVQARAEAVERELASARQELLDQRQLAGVGEVALRDLEERLRRAEQRVELLFERRQMTEARLAELSGDLEAGARDLAELMAEGERELVAAGNRAELESAVETGRIELHEAEAAAANALRLLSRAEDELRQARGHSAAVEERGARLQRSLRAAEREADEIAGRRNSLLTRLRKYGSDCLLLGCELKTNEVELAARDAELASARRQLLTAREAVDRADQAARETSRSLEAARARLEMLSRLRQEQLGGDAALDALVEAAARGGKDTPPRLLALLSEIITVQKGLEGAIEAALDDLLHAVIVAGNPDVEAAIATLMARRTGRATVIPLGDLKPVHALNIVSERGVLGVASRLVKCESRYRELVDTLLGRTIIVEDLVTARSVLRRGLGTVITLDGVVLRPNGAATAGSAGAMGLAFAYQQEIEALPGAVAELQALDQARGVELARAADHARAQDARLRDHAAGVELLQSRVVRQRQDLAASRAAIAKLRGEALFIRSAAGTLRERRQSMRDESRGLDDDRRRHAQYVRGAQVGAEEARRTLDETRRPVELLRAQLAEAEASLAALARHEATVSRLLSARRAALERLAVSQAAKQAELLARRLELESVDAEREQLQQDAVEAAREIEHRRSLIAPVRDRLAALTTLERELADGVMAERTSQLSAERSAMESEAAVSRHAQALDRLREEMEAEGYEPAAVEPVADGAAAARTQMENGGRSALEPVATGARGTEVATLQTRVRTLRGRIRQLGPVNAQAEGDYRESNERYEFLTSQVADLQTAEKALQEALEELRHVVRERFRETFHIVNAEFSRYFKLFFGGGAARLVLTEPEDYGESGVDVLAQPPGKRQQHLQLLSGGERSMTAVALLFALLETNPAPFCILDEVDAALDEANVGRFADALQELAKRTQFVLITHNRFTIQAARTIYGISMGGDGTSSVLSLRLEDVAAGA